MPTGALTSYLDVAQVSLYVFWLFFFALVFYLRREDRREGYPVEDDQTGRVATKTVTLDADPKTFVLPHDEGVVHAPSDDARDTRPLTAERTAVWPGAPYEPTGDPMVSGMGPAAWCERADHIELTWDGKPAIKPLRAVPEFKVSRHDTDPHGAPVLGADGITVGTVVDVWVDFSEHIVRYFEVELAAAEGVEASRVMLPVPFARLHSAPAHVKVHSIMGHHFPMIPKLKNADEITLLEEEKIAAFYNGGRLYADPSRPEPIV